MKLCVFNEFARKDVLEEVKRLGLCEVDIAEKPFHMATTPEEAAVLRTNAKLITIAQSYNTLRDPFDNITEESYGALQEAVDGVLKSLCELGFRVEIRTPKTSAGCPMVDRVILSFPEDAAPQ